ncbi:hypothetical protein QL285_077890 [Trifolium repens]|nr:hypothetical protein QL285_077890 [Trifolium repens]
MWMCLGPLFWSTIIQHRGKKKENIESIMSRQTKKKEIMEGTPSHRLLLSFYFEKDRIKETFKNGKKMQLIDLTLKDPE